MSACFYIKPPSWPAFNCSLVLHTLLLRPTQRIEEIPIACSCVEKKIVKCFYFERNIFQHVYIHTHLLSHARFDTLEKKKKTR